MALDADAMAEKVEKTDHTITEAVDIETETADDLVHFEDIIKK